IQAERDQLQETVINLQRDLESLKRAKQAQEADVRQNWFMIGAGVLFSGVLLGLILPRMSWRKRSSWDSF
ncbi:MAG: TIGR04211 family SH3 domain-containing protein, partial [Methylococcaceae bacterium]|nr:TIGR04211 family SH3 domain-containing protein [Methylococcaceae bacterium]